MQTICFFGNLEHSFFHVGGNVICHYISISCLYDINLPSLFIMLFICSFFFLSKLYFIFMFLCCVFQRSRNGCTARERRAPRRYREPFIWKRFQIVTDNMKPLQSPLVKFLWFHFSFRYACKLIIHNILIIRQKRVLHVLHFITLYNIWENALYWMWWTRLLSGSVSLSWKLACFML